MTPDRHLYTAAAISTVRCRAAVGPAMDRAFDTWQKKRRSLDLPRCTAADRRPNRGRCHSFLCPVCVTNFRYTWLKRIKGVSLTGHPFVVVTEPQTHDPAEGLTSVLSREAIKRVSRIKGRKVATITGLADVGGYPGVRRSLLLERHRPTRRWPADTLLNNRLSMYYADPGHPLPGQSPWLMENLTIGMDLALDSQWLTAVGWMLGLAGRVTESWLLLSRSGRDKFIRFEAGIRPRPTYGKCFVK